MTFFIIIVTNDLDVCSVFPDNDKMNTAGVTGWRRVLSLLWHLILPLFFFSFGNGSCSLCFCLRFFLVRTMFVIPYVIEEGRR